MIFVNLPVHDLQAATKFYLAVGGTMNPQFSNEQASSIMFSDSIGVMLLTHQHYAQFTTRPIGDPKRESQMLIVQILRDEPPRPRTLNPRIPRDL